MDFTDVVRRRRMVRNYLDEPVDKDVVQRIVDTARRAPSAGFTQGQYLVVVTDPAMRKAIADLGQEARYVAAGLPPWMSSAPAHVVVCVSEADYHERYREPDKLTDEGEEMEWPVPYWWVDAGAALMLLLLAVVDAGLSAGFFGIHRLSGLKELLGIPEDVIPIGVVTIGHAAPEQPPSSARRGWKAIDESVRWERW
jgi:FMN reductase [NAD(P)H]